MFSYDVSLHWIEISDTAVISLGMSSSMRTILTSDSRRLDSVQASVPATSASLPGSSLGDESRFRGSGRARLPEIKSRTRICNANALRNLIDVIQNCRDFLWTGNPDGDHRP
jgi:hypothetical protein